MFRINVCFRSINVLFECLLVVDHVLSTFLSLHEEEWCIDDTKFIQYSNADVTSSATKYITNIVFKGRGGGMKQRLAWSNGKPPQAIFPTSRYFVTHAARHGNAPVSRQTLFHLTSFLCIWFKRRKTRMLKLNYPTIKGNWTFWNLMALQTHPYHNTASTETQDHNLKMTFSIKKFIIEICSWFNFDMVPELKFSFSNMVICRSSGHL